MQFFIPHESKVPLSAWKARFGPLNIVALRLMGDLNAQEMQNLVIRVFEKEL